MFLVSLVSMYLVQMIPTVNRYYYGWVYDVQWSQFCMLKKKKYILLMFQNITQIGKNKLFFLMISNGEK